MGQFTNLDHKTWVLTTRVEQTESIAAALQAESLLLGVKPPILEAIKGQIHIETIPSLLH